MSIQLINKLEKDNPEFRTVYNKLDTVWQQLDQIEEIHGAEYELPDATNDIIAVFHFIEHDHLNKATEAVDALIQELQDILDKTEV